MRIRPSMIFSTVSALLILSGLLWADDVNPDMASSAARTHIKSMKDTWRHISNLARTGLELERIVPLIGDENETVGYVAELTPHGFVLLSADTEIYPVIAYSYRVNFPWEESQENILLDMSRHSLLLGRKALEERPAIKKASDESMWSDYVEGNVIEGEIEQWPEVGSTSTGGWVETTWTQKWPNNHYCPKDPSNGAKCVVGCVATAMSQIIDYHADKDNYLPVVKLEGWDRYTSYNTDPPIYIDGDSSKYDFPSFDALNEYMIDVSNAYNSDSKLTYHELGALSFVCGISVKMQYSSGGSGAQVKTVARALRRKFNYPSPTYITVSQTMYDKLKSNMKSALPAELSIYSSGGGAGHAIVCDGLREEEGKPDYYHLNYGWGEGSPKNIVNCWFTLPEGMWGFDIIGGAVLDIVPPVGSAAVTEQPLKDKGGIQLDINTLAVDGKFRLFYIINEPSDVKASVYDAAGTKVRTLFEKNAASGAHTFSFEPTDENTRPLPDGSYFLIFTDRRTTVTRKIIVTD